MIAFAEFLFWTSIIVAGVILGGCLLLEIICVVVNFILRLLNLFIDIRNYFSNWGQAPPQPPPENVGNLFNNIGDFGIGNINIGGIGQDNPRRQGRPIPPNPKRRR